MALPEFVVVDPMTALHLAILLGPSRRDVAVSNAGGLHGEREVEPEFCAVVRLQLVNGKRHRGAEFPEERQAGAMIELPIQAQDTEPRAVVQRGVLENRCRFTRTNLTSGPIPAGSPTVIATRGFAIRLLRVLARSATAGAATAGATP
jgi:hypothetical protein